MAHLRLSDFRGRVPNLSRLLTLAPQPPIQHLLGVLPSSRTARMMMLFDLVYFVAGLMLEYHF